MATLDDEKQLELFSVTPQAAPRPERRAMGWVAFQLRYDQTVMASMAAVIALTVVFACGVERGKHLVRAERMLLARQDSQAGTRKPSGGVPSKPAAPDAERATSATPASPRAGASPIKAPEVQEPVTSASRKGRYAVQVVTYSRPQLAKRELERLKARGERAFLVMREGRTSVYVGPFPNKGNASEKLTMLRSEYRDCFVRTL